MTIGQGRPNPVRAGQGRGNPVRAQQGGPGAAQTDIDYNVLLIVIDDIGVEWFNQYYDWWGPRWEWASDGVVSGTGTVFPLSWFEEMADAGLLFYDASAMPICGPTRTGIQTGRYGFRHGHNTNIRDPGGAIPAIGAYAVPSSELFLAEHIKAKRPDYHTGHFGKWHMADQFSVVSTGDAYGCPTLAPDVNLTHPAIEGYDYSYSHPANIGGAYTWWPILNGVVQTQIQGDATATFDETTYPSAIFSAAASAWITSKGNDPWFCYVAFGPPHSQFRVPPLTMVPLATIAKINANGLIEGDQETGSVNTNARLYTIWQASMQATDEACRRIWEGMTPEVQARTVVIVTGDNGTTSEAVQTGFNHSKRQIYWGGTRVPFFIRGPIVANPGERTTAVVVTQDIFDTVTDIIGIDRASSTRDSVSLMPLIQNTVNRQDPNALHDYIYVSLGTNTSMNGQNEQWAVYDGRFRTGLMAGLSSTIITDEFEDPFETEDRTGFSDEVNEAKAAGIAWKTALNP